MKYVLSFLLAAASISLIYVLTAQVSRAVARSEVFSCNELVAQSEEGYRNFYITSWQKDMCDAHGIFINAPVGDSK